MTEQIGTSALLRTWANNGTVVVPANSKVDEGWLRGEQPPHEWMNYIHNVLGQKINHALSRGVADWNSSTEYLSGAVVNRDGTIWVALDTNTNSAPTGANANWAQVADTSDIEQIISEAGGVTEDGEQTLTQKTIAFGNNTLTGVAPTNDPTFTGDIEMDGAQRANVVAVPALDIDCSAGNYFTKAISADSTFTFSGAPSGSYGFFLRVTVTGDRAITWPASVEFPGDTAPVLEADKTHLFGFVTDNGGATFRGSFLKDYEA